MLVVVVDESAKKAWVRSRRIVAKYLSQVAGGTWIGSLSTEGLSELHSELREKASKNTAVACYRIHSSRRFCLEWVVGSKENWNEDGLFAFKERTVSSGNSLCISST